MAEMNLKNCRFCGKPIKADLVICPICGYNSQTDTRDPAFETTKNQPGNKKAAAAVPGQKPKSNLMRLLKPVLIVFFLVMGYSAYYNYHLGDVIRAKVQEMTDPKAKKAKKEQKTRYANAAVKKSSGVKDIIRKVIPEQSVEEKRKKTLTLEGLVYDPGGKSFATINGQVVSEGESVAGAKVVKINKDSVEVEINGIVKVLQVSESASLSPAPSSVK